MFIKNPFAKYAKKPSVEVTPKTPEEIEAELKEVAIADAIERSGEAEKIIYGDL